MIREDVVRLDQTEFLDFLKIMVEWLGVGQQKASLWAKKTIVALYQNLFEPSVVVDEKKAQWLQKEIKTLAKGR